MIRKNSKEGKKKKENRLTRNSFVEYVSPAYRAVPFSGGVIHLHEMANQLFWFFLRDATFLAQSFNIPGFLTRVYRQRHSYNYK